MTRVRQATPTVACIDDYCAHYRAVFHNVRHFEQFTQLILGMLAETKRKSLPRLAKTVHADHQALHHFLANAEWSLDELRAIRLHLTREAVAGRPITLCIDETGDPKKGHTTDYVASQYLGSQHQVEPGIVSVNAYGVLANVTVPLAYALYKPKTCLKPGDVFRTKPELALDLIRQLLAFGFSFDVVLADTVYGEHHGFVTAMDQLRVHYVVAIRSTHGVWLDVRERIRTTSWRPFERVFADGSSQQRYLRETIFGRRGSLRYFQITTDPVRRPAESTWQLMTNLPGNIEQSVGNTFGLRTWIEYGFKQAKDELGWADFRLTEAASIERWWELVLCAYLFVSLQAPVFALPGAQAAPPLPAESASPLNALPHPAWTDDASWKHRLDNLRLLLQPFICACLLLPWLRLFPLPHLTAGLADLCALMNNTYRPLYPT
jgi:SRSO17 transposase